MKKLMFTAVVFAMLAGCNSAPQTGPVGSVTADGTVIHANQIPTSVTAAFSSEHPYAKITQVAEESDASGPSTYTIQYTRPDGSAGKAIYAPTGQLLSDNQ